MSDPRTPTHDPDARAEPPQFVSPILGRLDPDVWTEPVASAYDASSTGMFSPEVLDPTVDFLFEHAADGDALEFAIGTGRVAIPLSGRGVPVSGIDSSAAMLAQLARAPGGAAIPVTLGSMSSAAVEGSFSLVFLVFNGITNLLTQREQVECFRNAARHLRHGGSFVVEVFVPDLRRLLPGETARPFEVGTDYLGIDSYDVANQLMVSHHYRFGATGGDTFQSPHRYVWPSELDLMAELAGLELTERWADWTRTPFTSESESHVSVWRKGSS